MLSDISQRSVIMLPPRSTQISAPIGSRPPSGGRHVQSIWGLGVSDGQPSRARWTGVGRGASASLTLPSGELIAPQVIGPGDAGSA